MAHLNDTATVSVDMGEFGVKHMYVSDELINQSTWKDTLMKNITIDSVIINYNYLVSAYSILNRITPKEKHYSHIKTMIHKERPFWQIELGLLGLAKFKKESDYVVIKDIMLKNSWQLSSSSFELMKDYPNDIYLEVLKLYSEKNLFKNICIFDKTDDALNFIETVASYKQKNSFQILNTLLLKIPSNVCLSESDKDDFKNKIFESVWDNQCEAYSELLKTIKPIMLKREKKTSYIDMPSEPIELDTTKSKEVRWY
jgi:hypothetical protein